MRLTRIFSPWVRTRQSRVAINRWSRPHLEPLEPRNLPSTGLGSAGQALLNITDPIVTYGPGGGAVTGSTSGTATPQGLTPAQLRQTYGFNNVSFGNGVTGDGTGQTIAIVDAYQQPNLQADLHAFDQQFGLPDPTLTIKNLDNTPDAPVGNWGIETSLDVEWAHALAPGASILLVEASDLFAAADYARQQPGVSVVSMSWDEPEFTHESTYDAQFATPAGDTNGVTFIAATGDQGVPGEYPAFSPNVLAVGGTLFTSPLNTQGDYTAEAGWSSSGGGLSQSESQLSFQQGVVTQSTSARAIPDVAFDADSLVAVYDSYDFGPTTPWASAGVGGTSLGVPAWAALIATADQGRALLGNGTLDTDATLQLLYSIETGAAALGYHDITSGNNGQAAGPGYDLVTGLGTPNAPAIAAALSGNIGTPTPITPSGAISTTTPTFQWSAVPGALGYQLVVYNQATNTTVLDVPVNEATTFTPQNAVFTPGFAYRWQVQAYPVLAGIGSPSAPLDFNLPAVSAPSPISPPNNSLVTTLTPTFQWSAIAGAAFYDLTVIDQATPGMVAASAVNISGTSYTLTTPLSYGHAYEWYVQAFVYYGGVAYPSQTTTTAYFAVSAAGATTLLAPSAGATVTTSTPTLQWSAVPGAPYYTLSVFDLTANASVITDLPEYSTSYQFTVLQPSGHVYEWSVQVPNVTNFPSAEFTIAVPFAGTGNLSAPTLLGPSGLVGAAQVTFQWSAVPGQVEYGLYIFWAQYGNYMWSWSAPLRVLGTSATVSLDNSGVFLWWVTAFDDAGDVSPSPRAVDFAVSIPSTQVGTPTPLAPSGTLTSYVPTFTWNAGLNDNQYNLTVIDKTLGTYAFGVGATVTSYTLTSYTLGNAYGAQLTDGHTYEWYLNAEDISGNQSSMSTLTFTLAAPAIDIPSLVAPAAGTQVPTTTPTLQWSAVSRAVGYTLYLNDPDSFSTPFGIAVTGTSYTPPTPLINGRTYEWEVNAIISSNGVQIPGPESSLFTFTVSAPGTPTLTSPSAGATVTTIPTTFQWSIVPGATGYQLFLTDITTGAAILDALEVTTNSYSLSATLTNWHTYQWYVLAFDNAGDVSLSPQPLTFTVSVTVQAPTPTLSGTVDTTTPTFQWSAVAGAVGYYLYVEDVTANSTLIVNGLQVTGTSYTLGAPLTYGHQYKWWVTAFNSNGDISVPPPPQLFQVYQPPSGPPVPTPTGPSGTANSLTPIFQWTDVGAASYDFDVFDLSLGAFVIPPTSVAGTSAASPVPLTNGHSYNVQVEAFDQAGDPSGWSAALAFVVNTPTEPVVGAPTVNAQAVSTNQNTAVNITLTGADPNNPPRTLTFSVTSSPSHGTLSGTAPNLTYTPSAGYFGPDSFQFKANNGVLDSNFATVSMRVGTPAMAPYGSLVGQVAGVGQWWLGVSNASNAFNNLPVNFGSAAANTAAAQWADVQVGDFDGKSAGELVGLDRSGQWWVAVPNGSGGFTTTVWTTWAALNWQHVLVGDFNGDGKTDLAAMEPGTGHWWVALSNGNSFATALWANWAPLNYLHVVAGDFNGDGKTDIAAMEPDNGTWWVAVANPTGNGFATSNWGGWTPDHAGWTWDVVVGDFTGNGRDDLAGFLEQYGGWYVAASTGSSFQTTGWAAWSADTASASWQDLRVGDFMGNGKDQIAGLRVGGSQSGQWMVNGVNAAGTGFSPQVWTTWVVLPGQVDWVDVVVGDFNGDGKADIAGRYEETGQWWVNLSSGSAFTSANAPWTTWSNVVTWVNLNSGLFV